MKTKMKIAALGLFAAAMSALVPSHAFQSVGRSTFTAGLLTGGVRTATATIVIRDVVNPLTTPNRPTLTWSGVTPPSTGWKIADRLMVINSTVTDAGGGVQIYTRNTEADASPRFVDPTPGDTSNADSNPAGLLRGTTGDTGSVLPLAWSIKANPRIIEGGDTTTGIGAADPNNGSVAAVFNNKFQWLFFKDKAGTNIPSTGATAMVDGEPFVTMIKSDGIHFGQSSTEFGAHPAGDNTFVYFQANFATAAAAQAYQTTTITVETYIQ